MTTAGADLSSASAVDERLKRLAKAPILLIASDYDGTLSQIVENPSEARPNREAIVALKALSSLSQTHVAVISGRALRDLAELTGLPEEVHLVGSHGSEFDPDFAQSLSPEEARLRERLVEEIRKIAAPENGFSIEEKPASVALHYRNAPEDAAKEALERVLAGPAQYEAVYTKHGKMVVELAVLSTNKGEALEKIRHRVGASAALFFGDDVTDEDAFRTLKGPDIGVKVGEGETVAEFRVRDTVEVARILAQLCEMRQQWLAGSEAVPIEEHSLLSDQRTAALVAPGARMSWLCAPRIDSPAIFAELLGGPTAGRFAITHADGTTPIEQRYLGDSMILRTKWRDLTVTDYLDCSGGRTMQRAGRVDLVRVLEGSTEVEIEFAPRMDFGRMHTRLTKRNGGVEVEDTLDPIVLRSSGIDWEIVDEGPHQTARARVTLTEGVPLTLEMSYGAGSLVESVVPETTRRNQTRRFWSSWASQLRLPDVEPELVRRSALTLRALVFGPSGAISAAGTTSLPEHVGGVRNWDYRYCWLRDAAMAACSLVRLGSFGEAMRYLDWVLDVVDNAPDPTRPSSLQPLYLVTGQELGAEAEIGELAGYSGSRPVRVGNAANRQVQLDVFGPIVQLAWELLQAEAPLSSEHWRLVEAMVHAVEDRWESPDHGIWEVRLPRQHYLHSKVMCWLTVDRAIRISEQFLGRDRPEWTALRDRIARDILERGWHEKLGAFSCAYDWDALDAATLFVGLSGLLPADDERFVRTVEAIDRELRQGPTVYRYRFEDGLPGFEGGFHLCAGWLVEALCLIGRRDDAWSLFNGMAQLVGSTGLLSEQYGPRSKRALGNHPQAYSHLALIDSAISLSEEL